MTSTVTCDYASSVWENNSAGQNSCQMYAQLQGFCDSTFVISGRKRLVRLSSPSIEAELILVCLLAAPHSDVPYSPPNNACGCNVVAYNLMAGCAWCQNPIPNGWWLSVNQWAGNCTAAQYNPTSISSNVITAALVIPSWALVVPTGTTWNPTQASNIAAPPAAATGSTTESASAIGTASQASTSSRSNSPITAGGGAYPFGDFYYGGISARASAGIAIGVILGLWLLGGLVAWFVYYTRQKKRVAWYGPMAAYYASGQRGGPGMNGGQQYPPPMTNAAQPGTHAPLMYNQSVNYSQSNFAPPATANSGTTNTHTNSSALYQVPPTQHAALPYSVPTQGYDPPPPESTYTHGTSAGTPVSSTVVSSGQGAGAGQPQSMYGGSGYSGNTGSVYGVPQQQVTQPQLQHSGLPPGAAPAQPGGGYRGHAEVH